MPSRTSSSSPSPPTFWAYLYQRTDQRSAASKVDRLRRGVERLNTKRLHRRLEELSPHAIICTHFLPAELLGRRCGCVSGIPIMPAFTQVPTRPMIVISPIPGQEDRHADFLLEAGAALKAVDVAALEFKVRRLLSGPALLAKMRQCMRDVTRPHAARTVLDRVVTHLTGELTAED